MFDGTTRITDEGETNVLLDTFLSMNSELGTDRLGETDDFVWFERCDRFLLMLKDAFHVFHFETTDEKE